MVRRTVLKDDSGILWQDAAGRRLLWSFKDQPFPDGVAAATDVASGQAAAENRLRKLAVYDLH